MYKLNVDKPVQANITNCFVKPMVIKHMPPKVMFYYLSVVYTELTIL